MLPLRKILGQDIGFGVHGASSGSADSMAHATELLFDALHIVDCEVFARNADGYAIEEDRIWFSDAVQLASPETLSSDIVEQSREFSRKVEALYLQEK